MKILLSFLQETFNDLETLEPKVASLLESGELLLQKSPEVSAQGLKQNLHNLQTRWDNISGRARDRKKKLQDAANLADNFHEDLNKFIAWLTNIEKTLNTLKPVSRVMEPIIEQIEEHKV